MMEEKGAGLQEYPQVNPGVPDAVSPHQVQYSMGEAGAAAQPPVYGYDQPRPGQGHMPPQGQMPQGQMPPQGQAYYGYNQPQQPVVQQPQFTQPNTTVIIQQQAPQPQVVFKRPWSTDLCSCCEDMGVCCMVYWLVQCGCGPCYECSLSSRMGENCCVPFCVPGGLITLRAVLRERNNIQGDICNDCLTAMCCYPCTLCQLTREMNMMGL